MKDALAESHKWYNKKLAQHTLRSLEKNNISGFYVETVQDACQRALDLIPVGSKVGYGGSLTLDQIGIKEILRRGNYKFIDHELPGINENDQNRLRKESLFSDVFLMSTNALTMEGHLVNIDGVGNRVAALIFGPSKVIVMAGVNKIVADKKAAIHRIRNYVAPIHARRRNRQLPCAKAGNCKNCHAPDRFCNALVTIEHQYVSDKGRITVIIIGQELGL